MTAPHDGAGTDTISALVVGAGLIGTRRARVAAACPDTELLAVCDVDATRAAALAAEVGCASHVDWRAALAATRPDVVVASTTNKHLCAIACEALAAGAHVLVEKPMGRNHEEACRMRDAATAAGRVLKVGFNHRYHPAVARSLELARSGEIGELLFARAVYGHGGRPGYENEWRGSAEECGGGELLDQGVHVIDLIQAVFGRPDAVDARLATYAWPIEPLEDNAFATLSWRNGRTATFHTSWTQWRNRFEWQVYGSRGAVEVTGLGGSYGTETLTVFRRRPEGGAPETETARFEGEDESWTLEWRDFTRAVRTGAAPQGDAAASAVVMETIARLYSASRSSARGSPAPAPAPRACPDPDSSHR